MKRIILIGIMIGLLLNSLYGDNLNEYQMVKVKTIQSGYTEGMIGWQQPMAGDTYGPLALVISPNNQIYVADRINQRINIYDINGNYIRTIYENIPPKLHFSYILRVDQNGNIIGVTYDGLSKIDPNGKEIFTIKGKALPTRVIDGFDFSVLNNDIFIYNDRDLIQYIDERGNIRSTKEAVNRLKEISSTIANAQSAIKNLTTVSRKVIESLQGNPNYLIVGDQFYSALFLKTQDYFKEVKDVRIEAQSRLAKKSSNIAVTPKDYSFHLIDYDSEHNSYWQASSGTIKNKQYSVFIYSVLGELLDAFYYGQSIDRKPNRDKYPATGALTAIAPSGDVYFLIGNEDEYTFYKVQRQW